MLVTNRASAIHRHDDIPIKTREPLTCRHVLDASAAARRSNDNWPGCSPVQHDGQVAFPPHVQSLHQIHLVARLALLSRLLRHQLVAEHLASDIAGLAPSSDHMHAAVEAVVERAQAAAACEDLRLDNNVSSLASCMGNRRGVEGTGEGER